MAERWAVASTAWSLLSTWNGGASLPASGDDVYANGFTVTIDQDIVANSLRVSAGTTALAGGTFQCSTTRTIALQSLPVGTFTSGTSAQILLLSGGAVTLTVAGAISGDTSTTGAEPYGLAVTGGTHVVTAGTVTGGAGPAVFLNGACDVTLTSAVSGGAQQGVIMSNSAAKLTVVGSITGGSAQNGVLLTAGALRVNAALIYGATGVAPITTQGGSSSIMFVRGGANLNVQAPSDDDWPASTGAVLTLAEGGAVDPKRFLNVAGTAVAIQ